MGYLSTQQRSDNTLTPVQSNWLCNDSASVAAIVRLFKGNEMASVGFTFMANPLSFSSASFHYQTLKFLWYLQSIMTFRLICYQHWFNTTWLLTDKKRWAWPVIPKNIVPTNKDTSSEANSGAKGQRAVQDRDMVTWSECHSRGLTHSERQGQENE